MRRLCLLSVMVLPMLGTFKDMFMILPAPGAVPETGPDRQEIVELARDAARKHNVDAAFVLSVMAAESSYDPDALSPGGAIGLMQVMPETAEEMGYDASDWQENIEAGTHYLGWLLQRYKRYDNGVQLAIAAYNAGPANVDRYRGIPPFRETKTYVKRVMAKYHEIKQQQAASEFAD